MFLNKKNIVNSFVLLTSVGGALGCAATGSTQNSESQKSAAVAVEMLPGGYEVHRSGSIKMPPMKTVILDNGLKVVFLKDDRLPRLSMTLLVGVGLASEPKGREGLNSLTASLLDQGTQSYSALQLADKMGALGTSFEIKAGSDFVTIAADVLSTDSRDLLKLYSEVILKPAFTKSEIERARSQTLAVLQKKKDNPGQYSSQLFKEWLYAGHSYANEELGTEVSIRAIQREDIVNHYQQWYLPKNAKLAIAGKFDQNFEEEVIKAFSKRQGHWSDKMTPSIFQAIDPSTKLEIKLEKKTGLKQAEIRIGQIALPRVHEDFLIMRLANEALGGSFGSRLNQVIRDDQGLTYSIYSFMDGRKQSGSFQISTFTKNETVGKMVSEVLRVFDDYVKNGITEQELEAAKNQLAGQFPRAIETSDALAFNILALDYYGVPFSYLTDFNKTVRSFSLSEVNAAIRRHLKRDSLKVMVYGDDSVARQLGNF